ncbi:sigma-54-dependent Fis family transcriptional regulator [Vibrio mimicus]|uniref:sigma-54-dependent transcriptional regulator n=1 Tax=Vibrio mimicus TaxID=674 RepID=UPI0011D9BF72|nr:sigma-54 dependent transcriptional regulator [Vibrio mimicus]TXZ08498.1 sigma-54-dependent Fis family transcriptional regulator [Vibrio mimicus]
MKSKVLLVEDSTSLAILYKQYVKDEPFDLFHVETGRDAIQFLQRTPPELIILDLKLPDMSGEEILDWINQHEIPTTVIIATAHGSVDIAVNLLHKGAEDFLEKPIKADRLKTSINLHLQRSKLASLVEDLEHRLERERFHGFIGSSLPMQSVYNMIESVAPTNASVFIIGESGTGKEVCAQAIHNQSQRREKPFVALNCGAIPRDLLESEIFGHTRGAFTGATTDRKGAASQADGGTLFLDELCEMELEMQKKLLRFLQTGTFTPLGSDKEQKVDVRIIAATNRQPLEEVQAGRFREDLYYRVHVIPIEMPPLRERGTDIVVLANHFLTQYAKQDKKRFTDISRDAQKILKSYSWPGNVRQLQNVIRNIVVLNNEKTIKPEHLPNQILAKNSVPAASIAPINVAAESIVHKAAVFHEPESELPLQTAAPERFTSSPAESVPRESSTPTHNNPVVIRPMWQVEREAIQQAIDFCDGNVINAAVLLELSPSTVYRKKLAWEQDEASHS